MDINEITRLIPHRFPILLIDRVQSIEPLNSIVCIKAISANDHFFGGGHYPDSPKIPGILFIEACAQAINILIRKETAYSDQEAVYCKLSKVKFFDMITPGNLLQIECRKKGEIVEDIIVCNCEAFYDNKLVFSAEYTMKIQPF